MREGKGRKKGTLKLPDPTEEQGKILGVVENFLNKKSGKRVIVVNAFAGTGKTTTCLQVINESLKRENMRCLYLVFNRVMKDEMTEKVKRYIGKKVISEKRVVIRTVHSLAYQLANVYGKSLSLTKDDLKKLTSLRVRDIVRLFFEDDISAKNLNKAFLIAKLFNGFLYSHYPFTEEGVSLFFEEEVMKQLEEGKFSRIEKELLEEDDVGEYHLKTLLRKFDEKALPLTHDVYLKKVIDFLKGASYRARRKILPYDLVILDESQDANPCFASLLESLPAKVLLLVGDKYQKIYGFRGSVNLMKYFEESGEVDEVERCYLTQSFRFGKKVEELANIVLGFYGNERKRLKGIDSYHGKEVQKELGILSRTNIGLFQEFLNRKEIDSGVDINWESLKGVKFERGVGEIVRLPLTVFLLNSGGGVFREREALLRQIKNIVGGYAKDVMRDKLKLSPAIREEIAKIVEGDVVKEAIDWGLLSSFSGCSAKEFGSYLKILKEGEEGLSEAEKDLFLAESLLGKVGTTGLLKLYAFDKVRENLYKRGLVGEEIFKNKEGKIEWYSTVHSAKGQEYNYVYFVDDFMQFGDVFIEDVNRIWKSDAGYARQIVSVTKEETYLGNVREVFDFDFTALLDFKKMGGEPWERIFNLLRKFFRKNSEEINLLYVALTRASKDLFLSPSIAKQVDTLKDFSLLGVTLFDKEEKVLEKKVKKNMKKGRKRWEREMNKGEVNKNTGGGETFFILKKEQTDRDIRGKRSKIKR